MGDAEMRRFVNSMDSMNPINSSNSSNAMRSAPCDRGGSL
jgi:hypothetical protein